MDRARDALETQRLRRERRRLIVRDVLAFAMRHRNRALDGGTDTPVVCHEAVMLRAERPHA